MLTHQLVRKFLWMAPLFLSTLACNTISQLIGSQFPDTTNLPAQSSSSSPAASDAACSALLPDILHAATSNGDAGGSSAFLDDEQDVRYLVVYNLEGDDLGSRDDLLVPGDLENNLDSRASHEYIWNYFASLIPPEERAFVTEFSVLSDGPNHILAGVSPTYDNPNEWTLKVDVVDAGDPYSLTYSLLHEFGHFLTLNSSQVPPDSQVFFNPEDTALREQAVASCPRYYTGEGCSNSGSYMDDFYNRFWSSFSEDWTEASKTGGEEIQTERLDDFYNQYKDQFLTRYAAISPEEDIAESWTYFILLPKPESTSITDQKILFFYNYPELVALREETLNRMCEAFPKQ
ncbi:MAG TPA: hypothetical protein VJ785_11265 [Anaerolineales bacterium]|nr:hypothetical protein [Anaerolineales bacterium]